MAAPLLHLQDYSVRFSTPEGEVAAVSDLDLAVMPGETLAIVGESGSGKSQTFNGVFGLLARNGQSSGRAVMDGTDLLALKPRELDRIRGKDMGMVFQDPMTALNPAMKIKRQLSESLEVHQNMPRREAEVVALEMLKLVGIPEAERRFQQFPHELSGGMRQRVVIALALAAEPKLIVADEPTTALDVSIQAQIIQLLKRICKERGAAVMLITHDMGVIAETCDRVAVLYAGRVAEIGPVQEVIHQPAHPYTMGLMASIPDIEVDRERLNQIDGAMPRLNAIPRGCAYNPRCPRVFERCTQERPDLLNAGATRAACWLHDAHDPHTALRRPGVAA